MNDGPTMNQLRKKVLKDRGQILAPRSGKPVTYDDLPSKGFKKTRLMKYMELKHGKPLEVLIMNDKTIYELESSLGIDATTISKWRNIIARARLNASVSA